MCITNRKTPKTDFCISKNFKKVRIIRTIIYNFKTKHRVEAGIPLNNRSKRAENIPAWHHVPSYYRLGYFGKIEKNYLVFIGKLNVC